MFTTSPRAYNQIIVRTFDQLEVEAPKKYTTAIAAADALANAGEQIIGSAGPLNAAVIACLRKGADWRTNKDVMQQVLGSVVAAAGIREASAEAAAEDTRTAIADNAETILSAWADALTEDNDILQRTTPTLSDINNLAGVDAKSLRAGGRLAQWGEALGAVERYNIAAAGARGILSAIGYPIERQYLPLVMGAATQDQLEAANRNTDTPDVWALGLAGVTPSLITSTTDLATRVAAVEQEKQTRQDDYDQTRKEAGFSAVRIR